MIHELLEATKELLWPHRKQVSIPPLDGPWAPDDRLDDLPTVTGHLPGARDIAIGADGTLLLASAKSLYRFSGPRVSRAEEIATFDRDVHGISCGEGNIIACVAGGSVQFVEGPWKGRAIDKADGQILASPMAALSLSPSRIAILDASTRGHGEYQRDYLEGRRTGRLILADMTHGTVETFIDGLDFPTSLAWDDRSNRLLVTEAWGARISSIDLGAKPTVAEARLENLPGFPWRIVKSGDGYFLSFFSLRTQLLDFVRSERKFRDRMMNTMEPDFWIAPAERTTNHLYEPLQGGQILHHGVSKAWAPPRSYGLIARLDADLNVQETWHSRHGGRRHGITGLAGAKENVCLALSRASGEIFEVRADV